MNVNHSTIHTSPKVETTQISISGWMNKQNMGYPDTEIFLKWYCCSVAKLCPTLWDLMDCMQHTRLPCPSLFPGVCSNSRPLSQWCYPISSSVVPFSSCPQSCLASGSFPMSWLFALSGQSIGASASASVLPMNIPGWFPLGLTSLISLQSKGLSRVFSSNTVWKHQLFGAQPSLRANSRFHTWLVENRIMKYVFE